mgnify:FL=1
MANLKISELTPLGVAPNPNDIIPLTDVDVGVTRSVKISELQAAVQALASNLTDISTIAQANGAMIASNGTNFVSLAAIGSAGLTQIRADLGLGTAATTASTAYATSAQGAKADSATQPLDNISTLTNDSAFIVSAGAPVQSVAGRTGTVSLFKADISDLVLGTAATLDVGVSIGNVVQLSANNTLPILDGSNLTGIGGAVEGTAVISTGEGGGTKFLREDGDDSCSWQPIVVGDEQLRGTTNPHIGAFPNQSLKVIDNPSQSVVVVSDSDGNLDFVVKTDSSKAYLNTPSSRLELTTGVSVVEDATEPDIEITTTTGTYSLITGDSDALGANGLPLRQGFNAPDIGANPAPLLISGGTIS